MLVAVDSRGQCKLKIRHRRMLPIRQVVQDREVRLVLCYLACWYPDDHEDEWMIERRRERRVEEKERGGGGVCE